MRGANLQRFGLQPHHALLVVRCRIDRHVGLEREHVLEDGRVRGAARDAGGVNDARKGHVGVGHGALDDALGAEQELLEGQRPCARQYGRVMSTTQGTLPQL